MKTNSFPCRVVFGLTFQNAGKTEEPILMVETCFSEQLIRNATILKVATSRLTLEQLMQLRYVDLIRAEHENGPDYLPEISKYPRFVFEGGSLWGVIDVPREVLWRCNQSFGYYELMVDGNPD